MITEITVLPKTVAEGVWRLLRIGGKSTITNARKLIAGQGSQVWTGDTEQELRDFAETLPAPESKSARAAALYHTLSPAIQAKFATAFLALSAQTDDHQKALGIAALPTENAEEADAKADMLAIFS